MEVDRIAAGGHNAIFGDHAVLLAAGYDFAGQEQQRLIRVVHEYQSVDLIAAIVLWLRRRPKDAVVDRTLSRARAHQPSDVASFGDFDLAALDSLIEGEERRRRRLAGCNYWKQKQIAALDWSEDAKSGVR